MKQVRFDVRSIFLDVVRLCIAHAWSRRLLNGVYLSLRPTQRSRFHREAAKMFRTGAVDDVNGIWKTVFHGKPVLMPLRSGRLWLDWDSALSITGHEIEVKQTYLALIASPDAPDLFLDVGANYGTHSLLFLTHDIETLSFEPNSACHAVFRELCQLNNVTPQLLPVALGATDGFVELAYPERDTWDGSTNTRVIERLASVHKLVVQRVRQTIVDAYLPQMAHKRVLIKTDTEGNELNVFRGASKTLEQVRPKIIFECWKDPSRAELFDFFYAHRYEVHALRWSPARKSLPLGYPGFMASSSNNFIALPL